MNVVDAAAVRAATPLTELIEAITTAVRSDAATAPDRHVHSLPLPDGDVASLLLMPGWIDDTVVGVKAVTYFPTNSAVALPTIHAAYLLFDGHDGRLMAVLDGDELTVRRTAAVSAVAASNLARPDSRHLLVVGTGQLAPTIARAHASVRSLDTIEIWGRNPESAAVVARQLTASGTTASVSSDLDDSTARADIICCVTSAREPLLSGVNLKPGAHVDLVGSFRADMRESDDDTVKRSTIFVDTISGAMASGDLAQPIASGAIPQTAIAADLRDLVRRDHPGRTSGDEITLFKSAGFAAADLVAAQLAWSQASPSAGC